jgi:hypothetical protein
VSRQAEALCGLVPVSAKHHSKNGLLPGWTFFHAPLGLACSLCGRPARYVSTSTLFPTCVKHARDF